MNRDTMISKVREMRKKAERAGAKPEVIALSKIDLLKMGCARLDGLQLVQHPDLRRGQCLFLEPNGEGAYRQVRTQP